MTSNFQLLLKLLAGGLDQRRGQRLGELDLRFTVGADDCGFRHARLLSRLPILQPKLSLEPFQGLGALRLADLLDIHQFPLNRRKFLNAFDTDLAPLGPPFLQ